MTDDNRWDKARYWTNLSRDGWGSGPWDDEPDKVQWVDSVTHLPALAVRHPENGHWCGYVGVGPNHPLHGRKYSDIDEHFDVHGGLTFSSACQPDESDPGKGVCHIPEPGEPDDVWWFGFDCAHYNDLSPGLEAKLLEADRLYREHYGPLGPKLSFKGFDDAWGKHYKSLNYVRLECGRLAKQLQVYGWSDG